jgi:hypothetical protein
MTFLGQAHPRPAPRLHRTQREDGWLTRCARKGRMMTLETAATKFVNANGIPADNSYFMFKLLRDAQVSIDITDVHFS